MSAYGSNLPEIDNWRKFVDPTSVERVARLGNWACTFSLKIRQVVTLVETKVQVVRIVRRYPVWRKEQPRKNCASICV